MKIIHDFESLTKQLINNVAFTIGTFDGLHRGHKKIINAAVLQASHIRGSSCVVTFDKHPLSLIHPEKEPEKLLVMHKKHDILESWGVDLLLELYFEDNLAKMPADEFLKKILVFKESVFIVGDDFRFGFENKGSFNNSNVITGGMDYHIVADVMEMGEKISSTGIRECISSGEVELAGYLLGRMYSVEGRRVVGDRIGRTLGFPTVNLSTPETLIPLDGVYKTNTLLRGRTYRSMSYIGTKPTFSKKFKVVETHLFGFDEEVEPGTQVEVFFKKRLRGDKKFDNKQDLINQLHHDKENSLED
ncbi:MAG: bifunctional riboflavin kinase/FAD synthetase [Spirochaetes bacterium]|nr:bifunctional riboflavin kinase/FAD synthetase [Spirochaetota bacterium]